MGRIRDPLKKTKEEPPPVVPPGGETSKSRKRTPKDDLWDAICALWGMKPVTKADRSRVGKLARDFGLKGATPEELRTRLDRYRAGWPGAADTPEALCKHWDRFGQDHGSAVEAHSKERAETLRRRAERDQGQFASDPGEARRI